jgi:hypothetical protein
VVLNRVMLTVQIESRLHVRKSYQRSDLHANIAGLDAEASAEMLQGLLASYHGCRTAVRGESQPWPGTS